MRRNECVYIPVPSGVCAWDVPRSDDSNKNVAEELESVDLLGNMGVRGTWAK